MTPSASTSTSTSDAKPPPAAGAAIAVVDNTDGVSVVSDTSSSGHTAHTLMSKGSCSITAASLREATVLPADFEPSDHDVVIGRGKQARTAPGNTRLRLLIEWMIPEYQAAAHNKDDKSYIIKEIVTQIRKSCANGGGFCKFDKTRGQWVEVGDFLAREKVSQTFRDCMGAEAYSSSNPFKRRRRSVEKRLQGSNPDGEEPPAMSGGSLDSSTHSHGTSTRVPSCPVSPQTPSCATRGIRPATMMVMNGGAPRVVNVVSPMTPKRPGDLGFARRLLLHSQRQAQAQVRHQQQLIGSSPRGGRIPMPRPMLLTPTAMSPMTMLQQQQRHRHNSMMVMMMQRRRARHAAMMNLPRPNMNMNMIVPPTTTMMASTTEKAQVPCAPKMT